ncbi:CaiB/BaiF CoA transferase family protein [Meiothermus hypogaeus]|uniref:CoA transferase n=2 Tax=Meiothermus hypogaeus TaxID=884155 RepID=A0A511R0U3_9DEIN|nr:CoA transferase [Meiothermus hypogaeus]RIH78730.1 Acetyl-CoA:oxalate CoA-transferase [Meiothermus hypogaeus]GEM83241.1 CoA transferase [Meiothermus hypogaeus NBRC 106114]
MGALDGLKVLDLSRILAGPYCTQMLADLGAEVWKIEPPRGDDTRSWGPPFIRGGGSGVSSSLEKGKFSLETALPRWEVAPEGESAYFLSCNRGKKSVVVNLKDPQGQQIVQALARQADVLVENYKTGDLARYGLDYASLSRLNPGLIYLSITGYGQTGPRAQEPGYDVAVQGLCGIMSVTGEPEGPPMRVPVAWIDLMTGMNGAIAVLAALQERARSGLGQHIDLALFDVGLAAMVNLAQSYLVTQQLPERLGNAHPQIVPYGAFSASDGWFMLTVGNDEQYRRVCEAIEHPELWDDERFQTNAGRVTHRAELLPRLEAILLERPRREWLQRFSQAGVPVTPINNLAEAFAEPQAQARGMRLEVAHPTLGTIPLVGSPLAHLSRTPAQVQAHPPLLGEHTRAVLTEVLGYTPEQVQNLVDAGVVKV